MNSLGFDLAELSRPDQIIRIPAELDVPITARVRAILDTQPMQRLRGISQLGLVSCVYPGAVHSRFEHSLGVYRLACQVLRHLVQTEPDVADRLSESQVKVFLLAALLHDIGHWPYCHPIEDMRLVEAPRHEQVARHWLMAEPLASLIKQQWDVSPEAVAGFLSVRSDQHSIRLLQNILNGPVDIDKMDYLQRDSLHAGVPYGRNFDAARLLNSFRFGDSTVMTVTSKGKTAAEMMVFSRYVMFSEVYWHHSVRSATAMLQRIVYRLRDDLPSSAWYDMSDAQFQQAVLEATAQRLELQPLAQALFGRQRQLYKRFAQYNFSTSPEAHAALAHRPFESLVTCAQRFSHALSERCGVPIGPDDLLIDAPPMKLEIQFHLDILSDGQLKPLASVSPVVRALATEQFDRFVKQVRVFVTPGLRQQLSINDQQVKELLLQSASAVD
jgi:HD superfamily phosphohydrolase